MDFAAQFTRCRTRIREIYTSLKGRNEIVDTVDIGQGPHPSGWNFHIRFKDTGYSLSISVPIDMMAGYCETAMFSGGNLIYRDDWGYSDVARFADIEDLCREIMRLNKLVQGA